MTGHRSFKFIKEELRTRNRILKHRNNHQNWSDFIHNDRAVTQELRDLSNRSMSVYQRFAENALGEGKYDSAEIMLDLFAILTEALYMLAEERSVNQLENENTKS